MESWKRHDSSGNLLKHPQNSHKQKYHCMLHIPGPPPEGFVRKPRWELVPENLDAFPQEETGPPELALKKSFEELALEKIKGPVDRVPAPRQMKVDLTAKVTMQKECLEAIKRAKEKMKKTKKKTATNWKKCLITNGMISSTKKNLMKYLRVKPKEKMKLATLMWCKRQIFEPSNKWRWYCWWMVYRHIQQFEVYYTIYWESRETIFRGCWWIVC